MHGQRLITWPGLMSMSAGPLKLEPHVHLDDSSRSCGRDFPKIRVVDVGGWTAPIMAIEQVEEIGPKSERNPLTKDRIGLCDGKVVVVLRTSPHTPQSARSIAKRKRCGSGKSSTIQVNIGCWIEGSAVYVSTHRDARNHVRT